MPHDITIGGIYVSAFVGYAAAAFVVLLVLRPVFAWVRVERFFANPPLVEAGLYVCVLAALIVAFH